MSDLEKYILEHRDDLDRMEAVPKDAIWLKIKERQKPVAQPKGLNWRLLSFIGIAVALIGWGTLIFLQRTPPKSTPAPTAKPAIAPPNLPIETTKQVPDQQATPIQSKQQTTSPAIAEQKAKKQLPKKAKPPVALPPAPSVEEEKLQQLVALKQREIGLDTLDKNQYASLLKELDELEISVEQARKDFAGMPENERLVQTLIRYYELKIRILEQISNEINKRQYHEALEKRI